MTHLLWLPLQPSYRAGRLGFGVWRFIAALGFSPYCIAARGEKGKKAKRRFIAHLRQL
jgi:hypothetical protein